MLLSGVQGPRSSAKHMPVDVSIVGALIAVIPQPVYKSPNAIAVWYRGFFRSCLEREQFLRSGQLTIARAVTANRIICGWMELFFFWSTFRTSKLKI